jgi:hypothetical protein
VLRSSLAAAALVLLLAPAAHAGKPDPGELWATVNVCDTKGRPDTVGLRASMPGSRRKGETMTMRFQVQYYSEPDRLWHNFLGAGTDSGRVTVGSARYKARQSGWSFPFRPRAGESFLLRGVVTFEWRRGSRIVRRVTRRTTSGHRPSVADPNGYSAANCRITG